MTAQDGAIVAAIKNKQTETVLWMSKNGWNLNSDHFDIAASVGSVELMEKMHDMGIEAGFRTYQTPLREALENGQEEAVKWLVNHGADLRGKAADGAAFYGNLEFLKWLRDQGCSFKHALSNAIYGGHLDIIQWLYDTDQARESGLACAIYYGQFEIFRWLRKRAGYPPYPNELHNVVLRGNFEFAKEMVENNVTVSDSILTYAACVANFEQFQWVYELSKKLGIQNNQREVCETLVMTGDLVSLKFARSEGFEWDDEAICRIAVASQQIHVLQWAIKNGCPLSLNVFRCAVSHPNIEVLEYLKSVGCPWDHTIVSAAFELKQWQNLRWLIENGCEFLERVLNLKKIKYRERPRFQKWETSILKNGEMVVVGFPTPSEKILKYSKK